MQAEIPYLYHMRNSLTEKGLQKYTDGVPKFSAFSSALDWLMTTRKVSVADITKITGFSRTTVYRHLDGETTPNLEDRKAYAIDVFEMKTVREMDELWQDASAPDAPDPHAGIPAGIASKRLLTVPTFKLKTAAGRWAQTSIVEFFTDNPDAQEYIHAGRFKIEIEGDCMEPRYHSGQVIEFEIMRGMDRGLVIGECYVVCRSDGDTTFKCLISTDEDGIELAAVNQKKYPGSFRVPWQDIARISAPVSLEKPPPPPEILKIIKAPKGR